MIYIFIRTFCFTVGSADFKKLFLIFKIYNRRLSGSKRPEMSSFKVKFPKKSLEGLKAKMFL